LERLFASCFLPALFGVEVSVAECDLLALPLQLGGLGVSNLVSSAFYFYNSSIRSTVVLVKSLVSAMLFELDAHFEAVSLAKVDHWKLMDSLFTEQFNWLLPSFDSNQCHAILQTRDSNTSSLLSVLPLERSQFDLSVQEFRDGLALHYRKPLLHLPAACDGCGAPFSIEHALDCRYGGLVICIHNEVCDAFGDLALLVWSPVLKEPVVCDGSAGNPDTVIADLCIHGVWQPQTKALFDIRVINTDAWVYSVHTPLAVFCLAEAEKKCKYSQAFHDRRATFTLLCVSVDCVLGSETEFFVRCLDNNVVQR